MFALQSALAGLVLVASLVACGGGGGASGTPPVLPLTSPTAVPTATPSPAPTASSSVETKTLDANGASFWIHSGQTDAVVTLPGTTTAGGILPTSAPVTVALVTALPSAVPQPLSRRVQSAGNAITSAAMHPLDQSGMQGMYLTISARNTIELSGNITVQFRMPSAPTANYYLAYYNGFFWQPDSIGPSPSGDIGGGIELISFGASTTGLGLNGGTTEVFALATNPTVVTPTPSPTPAIAQSALAFQSAPCPTPSAGTSCFVSPTPQPINVSMPNYTGSFSATIADTTVAMISGCSSNCPVNAFEVMPVGAGRTSLQVTASTGATASIPVTVTPITMVINSQTTCNFSTITTTVSWSAPGGSTGSGQGPTFTPVTTACPSGPFSATAYNALTLPSGVSTLSVIAGSMESSGLVYTSPSVSITPTLGAANTITINM